MNPRQENNLEPSVVNPLSFISTPDDRKFLKRSGFTSELLGHMPTSVLDKLDVSDLTKTQISLHKSKSSRKQQQLVNTTNDLKPTPRKLNSTPPKFNNKNLRRWIVDYSNFLQFENLEQEWFRFLFMTCETSDLAVFQSAADKGTLNANGLWAENIPLIEKLFSPILTRGQVLKNLIETNPKLNETLGDYVFRFKLVMSSQVQLDQWIAAELFVLSLPDWLKTVLHRSDLSAVSYDNLDEVVTRVKQIMADNPSKPLIVDRSLEENRKLIYQQRRPDRFPKPSPNQGSIKRQANDAKSITCSRCHRSGHHATQCYATNDVNGNPLMTRPTQNSFAKKPFDVKQPSERAQVPLKTLPPSTSTANSRPMFSPRNRKPVASIDEVETTQYQQQPSSIVDHVDDEDDELSHFQDYLFQNDINALDLVISSTRKQIISKEPLLFIPLILNDSYHCQGLIDSGSSVSIVSSKIIEEVSAGKNESVTACEEPNVLLKSFNGQTSSTKSVELQIQCSNNSNAFPHKFYISDTDFQVICGLDLLPKLGIQIHGLPVKSIMNIQNETPQLSIKDIQQEKDIWKLLQSNQNTLRRPCSHPDAVVHLDVDPEKLKNVRQYPVPEAYRTFVDKQISEWISEGVVEVSRSSATLNNPLLTVPKYTTSGEIDKTSRRVCMDARYLNAALVNDDNFPVPLISDIFNKLKDAKIFTELDVRQAYTQFPMDATSTRYLGFTWNNNQYVFTRAIFGLKFMSSKFQRVMRSIFQGVSGVEVYIDNIIIYSKDKQEHRDLVKKCIELLTKFDLTLRIDKCKWFCSELRLLGHVVDQKGIRIDHHKHQVIDNMKEPTTGKEVEAALGLFNYFRKFLPNYAAISAPLEKVRKDLKVQWNSELQTSFDILKHGIKNADYLHHPDFSRPFFVSTDASYDGLGGVLFQIADDKSILLIECASRALSLPEKNYSATKLELAGVIFSLEKFRQFLLLNKFTLFTDHSALLALFKSKFDYGILVNGWYEIIMDYIDFMTIVHCPGTRNVLPDLISRIYKINCLRVNILSKLFVNVGEPVDGSNQEEDIVIHLTDESLRGTVTDQQQQQQLIRDAHALGHFASEQMLTTIHNSGYDWPTIKNDIAAYMDACESCQRHKIEKKGFHPLKNLDAEFPFDWIVMDLFGPLPVTTNSNTFVLLIVDVCTKMTFLRPLPDKSAVSVAQALINLMCQFGLVKIISSDNDTAFVNQILEEITNQFRIDKRTVSRYYPRANGLAERNVATAKNSLKRLVDDAHTSLEGEGADWRRENWDLYLPVVELSMNVKKNTTSQTSPFELFFGRPFTGYQDYRQAATNILTTGQLRSRWRRIYELVLPAVRRLRHEKVDYSNASFERTHSRSIEDVEALLPGTLVMCAVPGIDGEKRGIFQDAYEGPCVIVRRNRANNYILREKSTGNLLPRSLPISKLKVLDNIKPQEILEERRGNPNISMVRFSDGTLMWLPSDADILAPLRN